MNERNSSPLARFYAPFTFVGWDDPERISNPPLNFAEKHIEFHEDFVQRAEAAGLLEITLNERAKAAC